MDINIEKQIDSIFSKWNQGLCPGGQVAVRKKGEIIYKKNFGYASIEHSIPVKDDTIFHVASVSKQITVMCVLILHSEGKLSIDDDIRKYVPDLIQFTEPVTIRNMINNVSGIRDQWELLALAGVRIVDTITQEDALSLISKQKELNFEPLSQYLYSNSNFTLLAEIVKRISGKTLNEFATERIFKPLGMDKTFFRENHWEIIANKASSYYDTGNGEFVYSVLNYATYGATSLNTTAIDFFKWMDNYKNPRICDNETLELMFSPPKLKDGSMGSYAGGLFVGEYKGHKYIEHGGADAAFRSQIVQFTEDDLDIVVLSNTQNLLTKSAAFEIADLIFGHKKESKSDSQTVPDFYVKDFNISEAKGYYYANTPDLGIISIQVLVKDNIPHVVGPYGDVPLTHISGNHFKANHLYAEIYLGENSGLKRGDNFIPLRRLSPYQSDYGLLYEGNYESEELDTSYRINREEGILHLWHSRNGKSILYEIEEGKFVTSGSLSTLLIEFTKESDAIRGFSLSGGRVKSIKFLKSFK